MAWTRAQPGGVCSNNFHAISDRRSVSQIATAEQIDERVGRQCFDGVLKRVRKHRVGQAAVANDSIAGKTEGAGRRNDAAAPIAEEVAIRD
jgi:hypothetical protein